jgi:hypothetical protein
MPQPLMRLPGMNAPTSNSEPITKANGIAQDFGWSTVEHQAVANGVKMVVYGPAGVGKTVLCATLPVPIIFVSSENGLLSLGIKNLIRIFTNHMGMDPESAQQRAEMVFQSPVMIVKNGLQLRKAYEWLSNPTNHHYFNSVAWDSASESAEVMLVAAKGAKSDGRQAYGEVADLIAEYFRKFRDGLPGKHLVVTTKMGTMQDGVTGAMMNGPDFPGKQLGPASPYWLDECFRLCVATDPNTNQIYRYLQTQPDANSTAKDRSGALEQYEHPDLSFLIDKMTNS